ncbi:hypothetical protein CIB48_g7048 [Xylaria polymorpha]|nr:hypothetical protein CIB48_g7048 [Xylaria polymorpha]
MGKIPHIYKLLLLLLTRTSASSPTPSVRVTWAGSVGVHVATPDPRGIVIESNGRPTDQSVKPNYAQTKVGNVFFAREFSKLTPQTGIIDAAFNPGNLRTELQRHWTGIDSWITDTFALYPAIFGAYTELWATIAPELTPDKSGAYI